jgi:hypothetical protein
MKEQVGGSHYKDMAIQPAEYCVRNNIGKLEGDVIAYVSRWKSKNGVEDLRKARHTLDLLIELSEPPIPKSLRKEFWHIHNGGKRPCAADEFVKIMLRDGRTLRKAAAFVDWAHIGSQGDVIKWRLLAGATPEPCHDHGVDA